MRRQSKTHELSCEDEKTPRSISKERRDREGSRICRTQRETSQQEMRLATPYQRKQKKIIRTQQPRIHTHTHEGCDRTKPQRPSAPTGNKHKQTIPATKSKTTQLHC